jgi:hypothetical protein
MKNYFLRGQLSQAITEQQWKYAVMNVFSNFGGSIFGKEEKIKRVGAKP